MNQLINRFEGTVSQLFGDTISVDRFYPLLIQPLNPGITGHSPNIGIHVMNQSS
ncbi:hypothetical protein J2TS4_34020 [Paenibacillus sp. J2TS4]|nr:hypothetical protein J2TS4_34020 [Paenibacillus sp. J2TS4]